MNKQKLDDMKTAGETVRDQVSQTDHFAHIAQDLRFLADQRFKVVGVYLLTTGFLANVAKDRPSLGLGVVGIVLSYFCWSWEERTTQWWAQLYEAFKMIEKQLGDLAPKVYTCYPKKARFPFVKATTAVRGIYLLSIVGWLAFGIWSYPTLW